MRQSRNRTNTPSPVGPRTHQEPVIATAAPARDRVPEPGTATRGLRRMPALDGLRALAVVAVLLYHADVSFVPGGFLGVDVFFVLSGFLITALLLRELGRRGRIGFGAFYLGRARRLLPALFVLLLVVALAAAFVVRDAASTVRTDLLAAVGYVANWWFVVKESSYFEGLGRPPMLQHLWSLSVEEQFYLLWPAIALLAYRWRRVRGVLIVSGVGALASTLLMAWLSVRGGYPVPNDPSRVYFGTDTHAMGLLAGAALACVWQTWQPDGVRLTQRGRIALEIAGLVGLSGVVAAFLAVDAYSTTLYRGGFLVLSVGTAALVAAISQPETQLSRLFAWAPLRWVGERSYGIYLWHWPVFLVTRPGLDLPWDGSWLLAARIGLVVGIAELSYRYVEMPIRHGALARAWRSWTQRPAAEARRRGIGAALGAVTAAVLLAATVSGLVHAPSADSSALARELQRIGSTLPTDGPAGTDQPTPTPTSTAPAGAGPAAPTPVARTLMAPPPAVPVVVQPVTAVGDSVLLGAAPAMLAQFRAVVIDAHISRQPREVFDEVRALKKAGRLAAVVVVHAGTNGLVTTKDLSALLTDLKDRGRVVLVNTAADRSWRAYSDRSFALVVPHFPNVVLVDWNALSAGHRDWFVSDGVHLTKDGARAYAAAIAAAVTG